MKASHCRSWIWTKALNKWPGLVWPWLGPVELFVEICSRFFSGGIISEINSLWHFNRVLHDYIITNRTVDSSIFNEASKKQSARIEQAEMSTKRKLHLALAPFPNQSSILSMYMTFWLAPSHGSSRTIQYLILGGMALTCHTWPILWHLIPTNLPIPTPDCIMASNGINQTISQTRSVKYNSLIGMFHKCQGYEL